MAACSCTPLCLLGWERNGVVEVEQVQRIALPFAQAEIWPPRCCQRARAARERFAQRRGIFAHPQRRALDSTNFTHVRAAQRQTLPQQLHKSAQ